jgi:hypothetical protein
MQECRTPELIWNNAMATQFRQAVAEQLELLHLQQLNDPTAKLALEEDFAVEYDVLDDEIYIGGISVRLFLQVIRL